MADRSLKPGQFIPGPVRVGNAFEVSSRALPHIMDSRGNWTPHNAFAQFFDTVEIRTKVTPPLVLSIRSILEPGPPNPTMNRLKPTMIFRGPVGTKVIAPYGEVPSAEEGRENAWRISAGIVGSIMGVGVLGFLAGTVRQKVKARRKARRAGSGGS